MRALLAGFTLLVLGAMPAAAQQTTPISSLPIAGAVNPTTDFGVGIVQQMIGGKPVYVTSRVPMSKLIGPQGASAFLTGVSVTSLAPGATPSGFVSGPFPNYTVNLSLPSGPANVVLGSGTFVPGDFVLAGASGYGVVDGGAPGAAAFKPLSFFLQSANNLSDLTSPSAARLALGLATVAASGSASDLGAGTLPAARLPALTGDVSSSAGSATTTLATTGVAAGSYGSSTTVPIITVDAKGRITSASSAAAAGTGTVTSVALALPSALFTVSGSPVTSSGTLTGALAAQAPNAVLAGPASGSAATPAFRTLGPADLPAAGVQDGCVRLSAASATSLQAAPQDCSTIVIGGVAYVQPTVTLSASGLSASTRYYVYEWITGGAVTLYASTTGWLLDGAGRAYMSNGQSTPAADGVHRLIGMVWTNGSTQLADSLTCRCVLNWFNRRDLAFSGNASGSTASTTSANISGTVATVLSWANEAAHLDLAGYAVNNAAAQSMFTNVGIDGQAVSPTQTATQPSASTYTPVGLSLTTSLGEGVHTGLTLGNVSGGSASWTLTLSGFVRG